MVEITKAIVFGNGKVTFYKESIPNQKNIINTVDNVKVLKVQNAAEVSAGEYKHTDPKGMSITVSSEKGFDCMIFPETGEPYKVVSCRERK